MVVINLAEHGIGGQIRKKMGAPSTYGTRGYGAHQYGSGAKFFGIYQIRTRYGRRVQSLEKYYVPTNPQTVPQQANRAKFTSAVTAWQNLTSTQKEVYNKQAKYKSLSGYNLYISLYLLSN